MITTYLKNKIQNNLFTGEAFDLPDSFYIALSSTEPREDGTNVTEPVEGNYGRIEVSRNATTFTTSDDGVVKNAIRLETNESTLPWGIVTHYAIFDAPIGGNVLWANALSKSRDIDSEMILYVEPNGLIFTLSN